MSWSSLIKQNYKIRFSIAAGTREVEIVMQVKRTRAFGQKSEFFLQKIFSKNQNVQTWSWARRDWARRRGARRGELTGQLLWPSLGSESSCGTASNQLSKSGLQICSNQMWYRWCRCDKCQSKSQGTLSLTEGFWLERLRGWCIHVCILILCDKYITSKWICKTSLEDTIER